VRQRGTLTARSASVVVSMSVTESSSGESTKSQRPAASGRRKVRGAGVSGGSPSGVTQRWLWHTSPTGQSAEV
jgi:hypothetical protein